MKRSEAGFDLTPPDPLERKKLEAPLTEEEADVLLRHGTEAPFCGGLLNNKTDGVYLCRMCGLPLFRARTKFDSGTGWPSFYEPYSRDHIRTVVDRSHRMVREETRCHSAFQWRKAGRVYG